MSIYNKLKRSVNKIKWFVFNFRSIKPGEFSDNKKTRHVDLPSSKSHGDTVHYNSDGLIVLNNCDCLTERKFAIAYMHSLQVNDWRGMTGEKMDMRWRYYIVCYFAYQVASLSGDFVECGVYKGGYSRAIIEYLGKEAFRYRTFYLLDTFEGLVPDLASDEERKHGLLETYSHYHHVYDEVKATFSDFHFVNIIKGPVPDTLPQCNSDKVCYLSLDMNMAAPEIAAANYFWDKLVPGGIMVLDDYGFFAHKHQKEAFDAFALEKQVKILQLPTGQGIIFKPQ